MNLFRAIGVMCLLAGGAAHAAIESFDGVTTPGNGSVVLVKLDSSGSQVQGLTVDLGYHFQDFALSGNLSQPNTLVQWDFAANTIHVNGRIVTGVINDWASSFTAFASKSDAAESRWAVLSGSQKGAAVSGFLATGLPTANQLIQQTATKTGNMARVNAPLILQAQQADAGTLNTADNGAYAMGASDVGYVGTAYSTTASNGWANGTLATAWNTWAQDGDSVNFWRLNANGSEAVVSDSSTWSPYAYCPSLLWEDCRPDYSGTVNGSGTFTLQGSVLTWKTVSGVPEPESYVLATMGLLLAGAARHRRSN